MVYENIDHGNDVTCHARVIFREIKLRRNLKIQCYCKKTNRPQFSMVYTPEDHRNDVIKCSNVHCSRGPFVKFIMLSKEFLALYWVKEILKQDSIREDPLNAADFSVKSLRLNCQK